MRVTDHHPPLCARPELARTVAEVTRLDAGGHASRTPDTGWIAGVTARIGVGDKSLRAELTPPDAARFAARLLEGALFCILPDHEDRPPGEPLPVATELGVLDAAARLAAGASGEGGSALVALREIVAAPLAPPFVAGAHRETAAAGKGEIGPAGPAARKRGEVKAGPGGT